MGSLPEFRNEPYTDFSILANRQAMEEAMRHVKAWLGREYPLRIGTEILTPGDVLRSVDPSCPSVAVGMHHRANAELARRAVAEAAAFFPEWAAVPAEKRVAKLLAASAILKRRKLEFNAWLAYEAGKTWPEAEAETSEAIDFCEYYAREALRLASPPPVVQLPGEHDEMIYIPLGVGVVIPPWNFPLAILAGMTVAALVTGNTVVVKPSSETPTIAVKFAEVLLDAGFPPEAFSILTGSGSAVGDVLVGHPQTRFVSFTGSRDVGLRINELAAKLQSGQIWIKRVVAEMGGKDAIIVDSECDLDKAVDGVLASAFGYQGQKCSACSRAIVHQQVFDAFVEKLVPKVKALKVGTPEDRTHFMGPVISAGAKRTIEAYIETGRGEGQLVAGDEPLEGEGYFLRPTVITEVDAKAKIFQEEIFGPVLAVTRASSFEHALQLANDSQYGLTGAVFSNNREHLQAARHHFHVGNLYFNRKCTGAMVGAHPFGGFNLSGTDSKAGGPDYLLLFVQAKSIATRV